MATFKNAVLEFLMILLEISWFHSFLRGIFSEEISVFMDKNGLGKNSVAA